MANDGKDDDGKRRYDLVPTLALESLVDVLGYGAKKYGDESWKSVPHLRRRYYAAAWRHLIAYWKGEFLDPESGLPHLAHVACNAFFLLEYELVARSGALTSPGRKP